MRILVSITSYNHEKEQYLKKILNQYDIISKNLNTNIQIILSTNYNCNFYCTNDLYHNITQYTDPVMWKYCWQNKNKLFSIYSDFDLIIESDDDILISEQNINQYIKLMDIDENYIPGFLVTEHDNNNVQYIQSMIYQSQIGEKIKLENNLFFSPRNVHSACYIIDKNRLQKYFSINQNALKPKSINSYDIACISVSEIYFYYKKIIDLNNWHDHMINHLTNRYINNMYDKNMFVKDIHLKYRSVDFWKDEIIKNL